jgi:hypothetical protein
MKGIIGSLGAMKIQLKIDAKPIKRRPYHLNPKYKENVRKYIDQMLDVRIIVPMEPMEDSKWISPMVVQPMNTCNKRIFVDLHNLNVACVHDLFHTPFTDEVMKNVGGREGYSFINGFSRYH